MSKHLNDLSAVYMAQIAEETVCPVCGFNPCQCLEGTLDESCGCDHEEPKGKKKEKKEEKVEEAKQPLHVGRMVSQAANKDYQASKEKNPSKREKLETQARTIRTTVDMDSFKKRKPALAKEGFSNWRSDLVEVIDNSVDLPSSQSKTDTEMKSEIKDKKVKNKVVINPPLGEQIESMGGTILEMAEYDDEFDYILESVYLELIEEGFSEDDVEFGIESALSVLEEGYYDSATSTSKANSIKSKSFLAKKKASPSLKDRFKSAARNAIHGAGRAAAAAANTADKVKAAADKVKSAPGRAKSAVGRTVDRIKSVAKSGYESERKKSTVYRGAGVGRKEKIGEEIEVVEEKKPYPFNKVSRKASERELKSGPGATIKRHSQHASMNALKGRGGDEAAQTKMTDRIKKLRGDQVQAMKQLKQDKADGFTGATPRKKIADLEKRRHAIKTASNQLKHQTEDVNLDEKINLKKADMGDVVKDFYKSDAPQFKGKSKEKRREMAIAAKLEAERGPQVKEARDPAKEAEGKKVAGLEKSGRAFGITKKFRQENPGSRQPKKVRGAKPTAGELNQQRIQATNKRISKHGLTSREKKETQARAKYDSPRD